jgi:transcriptional regulator with XRE-family HTH domain
MSINKKDFVKAKVHCSLTPGEALKMLRELQNLSQSDLAKLTGISQSNISALENNTRQLGRERALVLAKALRVHPAVLLFPDFDIASVA